MKKKYPDVKIDYLIKEKFIDSIKYHPSINNIYCFDNEKQFLKNLKSTLSNQQYDLVVDLQNNRRSNRLTRDLGFRVVKFRKPSIKKFLLVNTKINLLKPIKAIAELYIKALNEEDIKPDEKGLELFIPPKVISRVEENEKNIAICPGSVHKTKMWPKEYFAELGSKLSEMGFKVLLVGGKADAEICEELCNSIDNSINLAGEDNLLQIAKDIKNCRLAICNDSGMMHTSCAMNVPVIAIFGSTVKQFGFAPYNTRHYLFEDNSVTCRPCSHIGKSKCPKKHFNCMNNLTPKQLLKIFIEFEKSL